MQAWPIALEANDEQLLEWRHYFWNTVQGTPTRAIVAQVQGRETIECDSVTAVMSYVMDEPYFDTEDLEIVKLNMRLMLANRVEKELGNPLCIRMGPDVLRGNEKAPALNVLNERTMLADLIGSGWLIVSERADCFMLRGGDVLNNRRWGGCLTCSHREKDGFCNVYRAKREDQSPVGACCVDFYPETAQEPNAEYVKIETQDVYVPGYTVMMPNQEILLTVK